MVIFIKTPSLRRLLTPLSPTDCHLNQICPQSPPGTIGIGLSVGMRYIAFAPKMLWLNMIGRTEARPNRRMGYRGKREMADSQVVGARLGATYLNLSNTPGYFIRICRGSAAMPSVDGYLFYILALTDDVDAGVEAVSVVGYSDALQVVDFHRCAVVDLANAVAVA